MGELSRSQREAAARAAAKRGERTLLSKLAGFRIRLAILHEAQYRDNMEPEEWAEQVQAAQNSLADLQAQLARCSGITRGSNVALRAA